MYDMGPYEGGPNATAIVFTPGDGVTLEGGVEQLSTPERHYDKTFEMEIGTFAGKARFAQQVKLAAAKATVKAAIEWMICDDMSCMPPDDTELTVELTARPGSAAANSTAAVSPNNDSSAKDTPAEAAADTASGTAPTTAAEIVPAQKNATGGGTLWALIIEAILWGFAALLTPCVFPMVPMTVSFFMKGEGGPARGRFRAAMYGFFIVALYTLPHRGHHRHHTHSGRRHRDGRHLQLAGDALAPRTSSSSSYSWSSPLRSSGLSRSRCPRGW